MKIIKSKISIYFTLILLLLVSCKGVKKEEAPEAPTNKRMVTLTEAQMNSITLDTARYINEEMELSLTGEVTFDENKISKVYPLVGGNVIKVNISLGDYVKKGDVLATIKSSDIGELQSQYEVAVNNLSVAKKNMDIAEELYKTNVNSETQLISIRNEYKHATSEVNKLEQSLSIYGGNKTGSDAQYNVLSPIEGFVVEKNINDNMEVRSDNSANLFTVSALNSIWVLADIYESDMSKVKVNDPVSITTIAYPDSVFKGTIKKIGNVLDPQSKVVKARVELDNKAGLLKPAMFAVVKVRLQDSKRSIAVKSKAIVFFNGNNYVMVYKKNRQFEKRMVNVGHTTGDKTYINGGVADGEIVVATGSLYVSNVE